MLTATVDDMLPITVRPVERRSEERGLLHRMEDFSVSLTLAAMVLIPMADAALRATLGTGIAAGPLIVQHLGLVAGMLGGMIAAREGRLLLLSTLGEHVLK